MQSVDRPTLSDAKFENACNIGYRSRRSPNFISPAGKKLHRSGRYHYSTLRQNRAYVRLFRFEKPGNLANSFKEGCKSSKSGYVRFIINVTSASFYSTDMCLQQRLDLPSARDRRRTTEKREIPFRFWGSGEPKRHSGTNAAYDLR